MWLLGLILLILSAPLHGPVAVLFFWVGLILFIVGVAAFLVPSRRESRRWYW